MRQVAGFTLVEVVVALAILALSLGVIYESFGWGLRRTAVLEQREAAWLAAQSLLAQIRSRPLLQVGADSGQLPAGLKFRTQIAERESTVDPANVLQPFEVTVEVAWGSREPQKVKLQSIELGRLAR